jgi:rhamnosyltransferase
VTFDQDSKATPCMISTMLEAYEAYPEKEMVASLSPRYQDKVTGAISGSQLQGKPCKSLPYTEAALVMTSGNLLKLSIIDKVNNFNEALFIDYVDIEFCLRCRNLGYRILEVRDAVLIHNSGFPTQHRLFGKEIVASNHSALRRYYITRNAIYMYIRFIFDHPDWTIKNAIFILKVMIVMLVFENDRKRKLAAVFLGVVDGLLGKMGKCRLSAAFKL